MKYEEYPAVVKGIEDLALTIGEKVKEKSMVGGLPKRSVPTTSIVTIEGGQVKETSLKPHDSTFYASFHEVVRMDLSSVRSRFLKNAISEVKQYNDEIYTNVETCRSGI